MINLNKVKYLVAKNTLNKLTADEIYHCINDFLNAGDYANEFIDIIENKNYPTLPEVLPAFMKFAHKNNIPNYDKENAVSVIIDYYTDLIVTKRITPIEGLSKLIADSYWDYDFHSKTEKYLGDSHHIEYLIGLYWDYDDIMEHKMEMDFESKYSKDLEEISQMIFEKSALWQVKYGLKEI